MMVSKFQRFNGEMRQAGHALNAMPEDLVNIVWDRCGRPPMPQDRIFPLEVRDFLGSIFAIFCSCLDVLNASRQLGSGVPHRVWFSPTAS